MLVQLMEGQTEIKIDLKKVKQKLGKVEITQEVMQKDIKTLFEGQGAFAKAKVEDKPIFLLIGYSTYYWCQTHLIHSGQTYENTRLEAI